MKSRGVRTCGGVGLAAALVSAAACSDRRHASIRPLRPPPESVRARLDVLAVQPGYEKDPLLIDEPWRKSRSVGKGALTGAAVPVWVGASLTSASAGTDYGAFTALGILLAPIGAVAGAITGPIVAMPDHEVAEYRERIESSFTGIDPATPIARAFVDRARTSARVPATLGGTGAVPMLELTVVAYGLRAGGGVDPPMQSFVVLRGRLKDGREDKVLHELLWADTGRVRLFREWAGVEPTELREEFERLQATLAQEAEEEMLELVVVP